MDKRYHITDLSAPELSLYSKYTENQLLHYEEPAPGLFIAESPKVIMRALDAGYEPLSFLIEEKQLEEEGEAEQVLLRCQGIPVYAAEFQVLTQLTGFQLTRGMLSVMRRKPLPDIRKLCQSALRIAILEQVVNPTNIGAIFRSAAALHMDAVLLTQGCSDPLYRRAARVSMGTVFQVPWTFFQKKNESWPEKGMAVLREMGFKTVAMALSENAISLRSPVLKSEEKLAVILGTEGDGLAKKTIADCDYTVRIDMTPGVDSLNVAAAGAVAFWELGRK